MQLQKLTSVRIAFIRARLPGVNLKMTGEHALTKGSLSLESLNSSVLFVIKGLFDLDPLIFKGQKPDSGHVFIMCTVYDFSHS